jgi:hypothetical protein
MINNSFFANDDDLHPDDHHRDHRCMFVIARQEHQGGTLTNTASIERVKQERGPSSVRVAA